MYTLYGNGINDDYPALQEMFDSGKAEIILPHSIVLLIWKTKNSHM